MSTPSRDAAFHRYPAADVIESSLRRVGQRLDRLEARAAELCARVLAARRTMLALSFGKDSMTVLHILERAGLLSRCRLVMWNASGMDTTDTLAMRDYVVARYAIARYRETVPDAETLDRTMALIDPTARHPTRDFVYECLEQPRWAIMNEYEIDGALLGIRQEESRTRAIHVATRGVDYWNRREQAQILMPVARWSTRDVFLYAARHDVPLHPIYDRMPALGFDRERVRLASPLNLVGAERGIVAALRRLYPETYRRYVSAVPAISSLT